MNEVFSLVFFLPLSRDKKKAKNTYVAMINSGTNAFFGNKANVWKPPNSYRL